MLVAVSLILPVLAVLVSLLLAETAFPEPGRTWKQRLVQSLDRIARAQRQHSSKTEGLLLFFSLTSSLLSLALIPPLALLLSPFPSYDSGFPTLVTGAFAPLILLGLGGLFQIAAEVSLALSARRTLASIPCVLHSFFWLPLLLAWVALAAYLPIDSPQAARGAVSSLWLCVLQPLGCLAFALALLGPYFLNPFHSRTRVNPLHNWLRELRMVTGLMLLIPLLCGRSCFAAETTENMLLNVGWVVGQIGLLPLLLWITVRLKTVLRQRDGDAPLRLWRITNWLALLSVTASFLAFRGLGMSDQWMHVLMNFSLLAIWAGFIVPHYPLRSSATGQD